ncbi:hypothetical protein PMIN06_000885 [Paraphaeosphaeria minitans]
MNAGQKEAITSLCSGGTFFDAIMAGLAADKYGRKAGIFVCCALFTIGAMIVPLYIDEIAPTKYRGRLIGSNNMSITGGQVISYAIAFI